MYRMAEEKHVIDLSQDSDEDIPQDDRVMGYCWSCRKWHPAYWFCQDCDSEILWHNCCYCCRSAGFINGDMTDIGSCENCREEWIDRHLDADSDAETVAYVSDEDD